MRGEGGGLMDRPFVPGEDGRAFLVSEDPTLLPGSAHTLPATLLVVIITVFLPLV